jgi:hypothetical protein
MFPNLFQNIVAADIRQIPVYDEKVETAALECLDTKFAFGKYLDLMAFTFQKRLQHLSLTSAVFNDRKVHTTSIFAADFAPFDPLQQSFK